MEELLDDDTLLHLLDDDFEEELDNTEKNSDQDELLDEITLLHLINNDEEVPNDKSSKKITNERDRNVEDKFNEDDWEDEDFEETPNEIQEEMLKLQEKLSALQEKLKQKSCAKAREKKTTPPPKVKSEVKQSKTNVPKKAIRLVDVPLLLPEKENGANGGRGPKKLSHKINGKKNKKSESLVHTGLTDSSEDESNRNPFENRLLSEEGRQIKKRIAHSGSYRDKVYAQKLTWKSGNSKDQIDAPAVRLAKDAVNKIEADCYAGIRLINPLVSSQEMKNRTEGRKIIKLSIIDSYIRGGDIEGDWVTFGVLVSKSNPKQSNKTGKTFSIWTLSDLRIMNKSVNLFLFGEVHHTHWKTSIGTVVGILNASILPNRDGFKADGVAISVDHPGKVLMMGGSKDFGHCKSRKKDGTACTMVVNVALCAYCEYHVQREYKKAGSKRMELQSMTGVQPKSLKQQILNKQAVMYGGQLYTCPRPEPVSKKRTKDKLTLESLKLQHKAQEFQQQVKPKKAVDYLSEKENDTINSLATSSEFLSEKLCKPTAGSRNLLKHLVKEEETEQVLKGNVRSITPKELLQMHSRMLQDKKQLQRTPLPNKSPELGRGIKPGQNISLDFSFTPKKPLTNADVARMRALTKLKTKGPIKQVDPNEVKKTLSPDSQEKIQKQMEKHEKNEANKSSSFSDGASPPAKKNRLSDVDINSDRFQQILKRKSSHAHEVDEEEAERQEKYFHTLEKKEAMEQKMDTIREIKCDVISCTSCKYTAHQAADLCLRENHPVKRHKAVKRFFKCADCSRRTWAFTRIPSKACKSCGGSNFERTTMMKPKQGPLLENEKLLIRGEEAKFI